MENTHKTKRLRWGTVSVLEFRVGYNASTVPESGGPPVGLIGRPTCHSYSMIRTDEEDEDSEAESVVDSDSDTEMAMPLTTRCSHRSRNGLWIDPMERARILAEENAFPMEDIALICKDVQATLDSRAYSQLDQVTDMMLDVNARIENMQKLRG
ncbi:hypothetical protein BBO99_00005203 [Phytophthora kernoviae]|uniref:Uncharacterized protein n=2 Tax=Phytophthora kernoviae TaxID=325452 RepID=A0A421EWR6_9STRA|nr:hypothetical protein G195_005472 [Phytophthora kernoviae 00238/432]KAG2524002.1 hypothetical protein JM16_004867 [Phytophthora kernoviae]KAG2525757.1 hypothetical protein JM18_004725 [Phytophthora kernoviae]RLN06277.1 hypothetical protein BBI17_005195 [Phytophthora kernoviae]RLN79494.1 hypothetical protein BBO99_00005203 [Phytophthora kernoviae]